jgi:D-amino-acid oxidase
VRNDIRAGSWVKKSYNFYKALSTEAVTGISMVKLIKAVKENTMDDDSWLQLMPPGTCRQMLLNELPEGYSKGYETLVPLMETQLFLPYLQQQLVAKGAVIIQKEVTDLSIEASGYDVLINCSGLGARVLCNDATIFAVRGQVALLEPGYPDRVFLDNQTPCYIVPRKDATIIGGTYEEHEYNEIVNEADLQLLLTKAYKVFNGLKNRKVIGSWAGLRPFRISVRLEWEEGTNIIHNYGHGGSGFTLAFGCASEVASMIKV